jgi:dienelactone hydrolase
MTTSATSTAGAAPPPPLATQANDAVLSTTRGTLLTPTFLAAVAQSAARRTAARIDLTRTDPERRPDPTLCTLPVCVGDPRLDGWDDGKGLSRPVTFTARSGATLSGRVWATRSGPARRPGIVVVNGSITGFEQSYWWAAQTLAKAGYVVMTFDAQGEGASDQFGEPPDVAESAGGGPVDGGTFYDGTVDAIDFFLSTPDHPYAPRRGRTTGTSHDDKQRRRVASGRNPASNPLAGMLDPSRLGLAGHSYGASAVSYLGQYDRRVSAVVAWDALCVPRNSRQPEVSAVLGSAGPATDVAGVPLPAIASGAVPSDCYGAPATYPADVPITTPALGLTGDGFAPLPVVTPVDPEAKARVSDAYSRAGVATGSVAIRGGNHAEWEFLPVPLGTLRGIDLSAWYTAAFFDHVLRHDPTAPRRLLSDRWRHDRETGTVDPGRDQNALSTRFRSRIDLRDAGRCEDLRAGCASLVPSTDDCGARTFGVVPVATAPDDGTDPVRRACPVTAAPPRPCSSRRTVVVPLPRAVLRHGVRVVRVRVAGKAVRTFRPRGTRVRVSLRGRTGPAGRVRVELRVTGDDGRTRQVRRTYVVCRGRA